MRCELVLQLIWKKVSTFWALVARLPPFRNNFLYIFCIIAHQYISYISLLEFLTTLSCNIPFLVAWCMMFFLHVLPISNPPHNISMGFKSRLWHNLLLLFEQLFGGFPSMLRVIILLKGLLSIQLLDRWPYIIFQHSLIWCRIHSWINKRKLSSPWGSEATPTIIFQPHHHSRFEILLMESCLWSLCLLLLWPNNSIFDSSVQSTLFQDAWYLTICSLGEK